MIVTLATMKRLMGHELVGAITHLLGKGFPRRSARLSALQLAEAKPVDSVEGCRAERDKAKDSLKRSGNL